MKTHRVLACIAVAASLSGCATKVLTAESLAHLPRNEGYNPLSIHVEPWMHEGSEEAWDRVTYTYFDAQNRRGTRHLKIPRGLMKMPPVGSDGKAVPMEPVMRDGRIVAFDLKRQPWTNPAGLERLGRAAGKD